MIRKVTSTMTIERPTLALRSPEVRELAFFDIFIGGRLWAPNSGASPVAFEVWACDGQGFEVELQPDETERAIEILEGKA